MEQAPLVQVPGVRKKRYEHLFILCVSGMERVRMSSDDDDPTLRRAEIQHPVCLRIESAGGVHPYAPDPTYHLNGSRCVLLLPRDNIPYFFGDASVGDAAERITGFFERGTEIPEPCPVTARLPPLSNADRHPLRVVERLIVGRYKRIDRRADALFESVFARAERFKKAGAIQAGKPLVTEGVTGDFVSGSMNSPNLGRVVVRPLSRKRRSPHNRKRGRDPVLCVQLEKAVRVPEFEPAPVLGPSGRARTIPPHWVS